MGIMEKLELIFRDIFDNETLVLKRETTTDDIDEWDSLTQVNIIVACEVEFGIKFDLNDVKTLMNVGDIVDKIEIRQKI